MGLQVSSYMRIASNKMLPKEVNKQDSEIPEKTVIRATPKTSWGGFQRTIYAKGEQSHRRSPHARPRAYADIDTTQVCSVTNHRVHKGQKRDTYRKRTFWQKKKLHGTTFLGQRYHVSTVGKDEEAIRNYIRSQEKEDQRIEQLNLFK
jgi:putative transposase